MENHIDILLLSRHGACRAAVAEAVLRQTTGDEVRVTRAAVEARPTHKLVVDEMTRRDIPLDDEVAGELAGLGDAAFDLWVTLGHPPIDYDCTPLDGRRPLSVGDPVHLGWEVGDPLAQEPDRRRAAVAAMVDDIQARVTALINQGYLDALMHQRSRTHLYLDALHEGIVAHDEHRCICMFNRAAEQITGYARDDVLGRDCHTVFSPDGLCGSECLFAHGSGAKIPGRREYEMAFTRKGGEDRRLKMRVRPLDLGVGRYRGVIAVMSDITEVDELRWRVNPQQGFHGLVGGAEAMQEVFHTVRQVSSSDYPVLITGESGTGKELVARSIHAESRRAKGPFVPINCGALPENILESELFGHVRGAFTGAIRDKKGRFELAHKGTLFLDEVGELTPAFQVKLLRVLQEKRFEMVGGERTVSVDVRIISATNRELKPMIHADRFREDLYYRLCVVPIETPPLRERREDIPLLVQHFLTKIRKEIGRPIRSLTNEAMDCLHRHGWPGNVRELINALQFAAVRSTGEVIDVRHLPPEVRQARGDDLVRPVGRPAHAPLAPSSPGGGRYKLDRDSVERALSESGGNKVRAAKLLGVGRATLYRFLARENVS